MRNTLAIISGIIVPFLCMAIIGFIIVNFNIEPFSKFAKGNFREDELVKLLQELNILYQIVLFPFISIVTGIFAGLIAKDKEYIVGYICMIPFPLIFFDFSISYFLELVGIYLFLSIGVYSGKRLKSEDKKQRYLPMIQ